MPVRKWLNALFCKWDWLQVEVSSQCHAACIYCPTAIYRKENSNRLMSLETFHRLLPDFARARLVYLQGWGEPLLNPNFFEMVRLTKDAGCQVGVTTNTMLLDEARLTEVVSSGVDVITFSLAGGRQTNDAVRKGTCMEQVLNTARQLQHIKAQKGTDRPEVHLAYMLLRSGLTEIEQLPDLVAGLGITQIVISTLDFIPTLALEREALIPSNQADFVALCSQLDEVVKAAQSFGVDVHYQCITTAERPEENGLATPTEMDLALFFSHTLPICTENIQRSAFISADGDVSPCVFTHLPVKFPEAPAVQMGRPYQALSFGNVCEQSLAEIWESKAYRVFRRLHSDGKLKDPCLQCLKPRVQRF